MLYTIKERKIKYRVPAWIYVWKRGGIVLDRKRQLTLQGGVLINVIDLKILSNSLAWFSLPKIYIQFMYVFIVVYKMTICNSLVVCIFPHQLQMAVISEKKEEENKLQMVIKKH